MSDRPSTPNVLLVIVDEWRAQSFGYAGDTNAHTPVIDSFAATAIDFDQAISGTPVCSPARASILTGQYPLQHGVYVNDVPLIPELPTLADRFAEHGYATGYIGKWHLFGSPDGWFGRRASFVPPESRCGFQYWKAGECSHDYWNSVYFEADDPTPKVWPGYDAFAQTDDAIEYMSAVSLRGDPFFLTLSYGPPHFPLGTAPDQYQAMYADRPIELRENVPPEHRAAAERDLRGYYAHMAAIDDCFGRLLDAVESTGISEDTVVVFTSDHGDMMWSQGLEYKLLPWEESIRVPLLVRAPGREAATSHALVNSPDLMPMLLGFADLPIPSNIAGRDLSREMEAEGTAFLSVPAAFSSLRWYGVEEFRGVRDARYTYVETRTGPWLLYDRAADPLQLCNRVTDPDLRAEQERLARALDSWRDRLGDEFRAGRDYLERDGLLHYYEVNEPVGYSEGLNHQWLSTDDRGRVWSIDTPIEILLENPEARRILHEHLPSLAVDAALSNDFRDSLRIVSLLQRGIASEQQLLSLDSCLADLGPRHGSGPDRVSLDRIRTKATRAPQEFRER